MEREAPLLTDAPHHSRPFAPWLQFASVASYFAVDLILRFLYQSVLDGDDEGREGYNKPAFLTLCGYMTFSLWGPFLVFPYVVCVRRMSLYDYYTAEWCGVLGFRRAAMYTCVMAAVLFLGNLGYVTGLQYISVALASSLSQGEAPFTVGLSVLLLGRVFGIQEQKGIIFCFIGIALIAIPPVLRAQSLNTEEGLGSEAWTMIIGVFSTLLGSCGFGAYQVFWPLFGGRRFPIGLFQPKTTVHVIVDTFATITLVGVYCVSFGWIIILFFHLVGFETFELPPAA
jgi:drug/metabolite transporter (DMT)-like permease